MRNIMLLSFGLLISSIMMAQTDVYLNITPKVGGQTLVLDQTVFDLDGDAMSITAFNYYISNIHIIHDGGQDLDLSDTIYIFKADNYQVYLGLLNIQNIEQINFGVGVPENINTQNGADAIAISDYPQEHPLSFQSPSMYWGWTSGYKHMLCDGIGDSNGDDTPNELFQLHNLGDANYKNVQLPVSATEYDGGNYMNIEIHCNLDQWLSGIDLGTVGVKHGTSGVNASVMNNAESKPVFTAPQNLNAEEIKKEVPSLFFHGENNALTINWKDIPSNSSYKLVDLTGKVIKEGRLTESNGELIFTDIKKGNYVFAIVSDSSINIATLNILF